MSAESREKKGVQTLHISGVRCDLLEKLEAKGEAMEPPVRRNDLLLWVLQEYADGRLVKPEEAAKAA